jgi:Transposase IS66 family/Transposase C of IS166 homeodomain/zinc-finger binding domain of transposase IS66
MDSRLGALPDDIEALKAALVAEAARARHAEAELAVAKAKAADDQALIAHRQLRIEKLTRQLYGPRSERTSRLLDQIELQFEELESSATEDEIAAEMAVAKTTNVAAFTRKRPARKPFPEHLPRERVIVPGPTTCLCCGGSRLRKLGEAVTETLESIPRRWKVIQHVREVHLPGLREDQPGAGAVPCDRQGLGRPSLLAMILFDDPPFGGTAPPAAMFYYSRDRAGEHPQAHLANYAGIFQADAYGGYNKLYEPDRKPGPILEAACWVHARRPFFVMADVAENARRKAQGKTPAAISPLALEAVRRIDVLFEIERSINGQRAEQRRVVRQELSAPLVADLESWMREQRARLSRSNDVAKAMEYMLKRWPAFTRFLDEGCAALP